MNAQGNSQVVINKDQGKGGRQSGGQEEIRAIKVDQTEAANESLNRPRMV